MSDQTRWSSSLLFCVGFVLWLIVAGVAEGEAQNISGPPDTQVRTIPNTLIIKIKPEFSTQFSQAGQKDILATRFPFLSTASVSRVFPLHQPPSKESLEQNPRLVDLTRIFKVILQDNIKVDQAIINLKQSGFVEYAEPAYIPVPFFIPNDEKIGQQYYLSMIRAYQAWDICQGDSSVVIGIIDSGTNLNHTDLQGNIKYNYDDPIDGIDNDNDGFIDNVMGWDLGEMDNDPQVAPGGGNSAHGAHMCGIAAASTNNLIGVAGVGFNCKFLPVKISDADGNYTKGFEGIVYAADHGCKVINCSWGAPLTAGRFGQDVVNYATYNRDALVVAASGNSDNNIPFYPASYENVLSVGATDGNDARMFVVSGYATSYGIFLDLCAPGKDIFSTWDYPYFYKTLSGTSMASAVASGAAALLRARFPGLTAGQTAEKLRITCDVIDTIPVNLPFYKQLGMGRINLYRALTDSTSPSIRILQAGFSDHNDSVFAPGDTVRLTGQFFNFLADAPGVTVKLICPLPYVQLIDSVIDLGAIPGSSGLMNDDNPLTFKLLPGCPPDASIPVRLEYMAGNTSSFEYLKLEINRNFLNISTEEIITTVTSSGKIGYNDDLKSQGVGFCYKNDLSILFSGGLMAGISYSQVSDVVYNQDFTSWDQDFTPVERVKKVLNPQQADNEVVAVFNDNGSGSSALHVLITQRVLTWNAPEDSKFVVYEYTLKNSGSNSLANLYLGLFLDWDIDFFASSNDQVEWDSAYRMGVTRSLNGGPMAGISLLSQGPVRHYAFDMNGQNGSINVNNGFTDQEKYIAMKTNRNQAGAGANGNNVADMVSSGPYLVQPGDSLVLAWTLVAGDYPDELQTSVIRAKNRYFNTLGIHENNNRENPERIMLFPNPSTGETTIEFYLDRPQPVSVVIYNPEGQQVINLGSIPCSSGNNQINLQQETLTPG
ncbi:MAG: S8 family serine peptidase, partial [Bacteroidetes bacterium]|nr:S8 family serine peptidase [Bacteroidota bacterium]